MPQAQTKALCPKLLEAVFTPLGFDGRWSLLTQLLTLMAQKKSAHGPLSLDRNWAFTPQSYRCPICHRSKAYLAQISRAGLSLSLHVDHDHFGDALLLEAQGLGLSCDLRPLIAKYSSYTPEIICQQCNWIDSQMKGLYPAIPKHFSFPPAMKSQLIVKVGKTQHRIAAKLGWQLWTENEAEFSAKEWDLKRDLQDFISLSEMSGKSRYVGYKPRTAVYQEVFLRYQTAERGELADLDFPSFLNASLAWGE